MRLYSVLSHLQTNNAQLNVFQNENPNKEDATPRKSEPKNKHKNPPLSKHNTKKPRRHYL